MLHIAVEEDDEGSVVRLSGRLVGEFVAEAERVCLSAKPPLLIAAGRLQGADADGLALLMRILDGGGRVEGLSGYLALRLTNLRGRGGH